MKTASKNWKCILRALNSIFASFIVISCDGSRGDAHVTRERKDHQHSEGVLSDKALQRYSDDLIVKHDLAVSLWFLNQDYAMSIVAFDDQNKVRLRSYRTFSKLEDKAEMVLAYQLRAINEFVDSYQGRDKEEVLAKWLGSQNEAKDVLRKFLESVQMAPEDVSETDKNRNEYERIIGIQKTYLNKFVEYREAWKQSNPTTTTTDKDTK